MADGDIGRFIPLIEAVIEGQKRSSMQLAALNARNDLIDAAYDRLSRQINRLQEGQEALAIELRGEIGRLNNRIDALHNRIDAVLNRIDELENRMDRFSADLLATRSELVSQYNEILNALQAGLNTRRDLDDLTERVARLEQQVGF